MVKSMPITRARINLGSVIKRIHLNKEYVILEKDGIPIAGIMDIDEFEDYLELQDPNVQRQIKKSSQEFRAGKGRPASELVAELQGTKKSNKTRSKR
jgi:hypothetical protein